MHIDQHEAMFILKFHVVNMLQRPNDRPICIITVNDLTPHSWQKKKKVCSLHASDIGGGNSLWLCDISGNVMEKNDILLITVWWKTELKKPLAHLLKWHIKQWYLSHTIIRLYLIGSVKYRFPHAILRFYCIMTYCYSKTEKLLLKRAITHRLFFCKPIG